MANKTDPLALHTTSTDPQNLLEPSTRLSIHTSRFWNEVCFGLSLADVVPLAANLDRISATTPPPPFLCLLLKLLQLAPAPPELAVFLKQPDFKYARVLAAFHVRLTAPPHRVYSELEPLLADFRKVVVREGDNTAYEILHVDEIIDRLLRDIRVIGITLPRIPPRHVVADAMPSLLGPRPLLLGDL